MLNQGDKIRLEESLVEARNELQKGHQALLDTSQHNEEKVGRLGGCRVSWENL